MLILRPYQVTAYNILTKGLSGKGKGLLIAPTGSGKTVTGLKTVADLAESKKLKKVVWVAHQTDLALQSMRAMEEHFPVAKASEKNTVVLNGVSYSFMPWQALRTKKDLEKYDILVVDEFHQGSSGTAVSHKSFTKIVLESKIKYQLYVTATPHNLDPKLTKGLYLKQKFNPELVAQISLAELEKCDAVCNVSMIMVQTADTLILKKWDGISNIDSDADEETISGQNKELAKKIKNKKVSTVDVESRKAISKSIMRTLLRYYYEQEVKGKTVPPTLMFASNRVHANSIKGAVREIFMNMKYKLGPNDVKVDLGTSIEKDIQKKFRDGEFPIMIVVRKAREGFDYPALQVALDFCPSRSKGGETAQVQKLGRVLRKHHSKIEARYYVPDSVNFYIAQRGIRQEFNPGFKDRIFDSAKGMDLISDVEMAKDFVSNAVEQVMALRQAESGEDNAEVHLSPVEVMENEYIDFGNDIAVDAVRKSLPVKQRIRAVKVAYAITGAYASANPQISSFRLFDGGICQRAVGAYDPEGNKEAIKDFYQKNKAFPGWYKREDEEVRLRNALKSYCNKKDSCYDSDFEKWCRDNGYGKDTVILKKNRIVEFFNTNKRLPKHTIKNKEEKTLAEWMYRFCDKNRTGHDPKFREWCVSQGYGEDSVDKNKEAIKQFYLYNKKFPSQYAQEPEQFQLHASLARYCSKSSGTYDSKFDNWCRKRGYGKTMNISTDETKQEIRLFIKNNGKLPSTVSKNNADRKLAIKMCNYCAKQSGCYDPKFRKEIGYGERRNRNK